MLVGYNNNVTYKGKVYHVQTEDSGLKNPVIATLLFFKGTILASKKTNYSHLIGGKDIKETVREMMKAQHKAMLKELIAGKYTDKVQEQGASKAAIEGIANADLSEHPEQDVKKHTRKTLDDILLDYILKGEKNR